MSFTQGIMFEGVSVGINDKGREKSNVLWPYQKNDV